MAKKWHVIQTGLFRPSAGILPAAAASLLITITVICVPESSAEQLLPIGPAPRTELKLQEIPYKIVYETYRKTPDPAGGDRENWELYIVNADGSNPVNLTNTADVDEMYPHASPDGSKICFVADELVGKEKSRNVYYMNVDGTARVKVAENAREQCWSADGKTIAYLKGEFQRYTITDYATKGLFFYELATGKHTEHPNKNLHHLYNICWSPDGNWFVATVHGGMGFKHAILAIEADGTKVFDLTKFGVTGCRPDFSGDGKRITWGATDWDLCVGDIDFAGQPTVTNVRRVVKCRKECEVYHCDFSPDGRYIAFSHGPAAEEQVGGKAPGWDICIADIAGAAGSAPPKWVEITADGNHNKEPDWVPTPRKTRG
jgi:Tol biopolymer transport system component